MPGDKQSLRAIHAALRCTIRLVEHFLTHSWLPPSYYDSEAQGEKNVSDFRAFFSVCVYVCVRAGVGDRELMRVCTVFIQLRNHIRSRLRYF